MEGIEMNHTQIMSDQKIEFLDILKEAQSILCKNINLIIFSFFASLPLFCFLVYYEFVLQKTFLEASKFLEESIGNDFHYYDDQRYDTKRFTPQLIQLCLLYLFPYHLLDLLNMIMIVDTASMVYAKEKPISLKEMIRRSIKRIKLKGPFVTSIYALLFSTSALLGLIWVVTNYLVFSRISSSGYYYYYTLRPFLFSLFTVVPQVATFIALLAKFSEWSAGWNMSLVISVLEESYGSEAFEASAYFSRGSNRIGLVLMLISFVWGLVLRLPCLFGKCSERSGGIAFTSIYTVLICMGNMVKWVICTLYFYDYKKRILEKKIDEEVGREANADV